MKKFLFLLVMLMAMTPLVVNAQFTATFGTGTTATGTGGAAGGGHSLFHRLLRVRKLFDHLNELIVAVGAAGDFKAFLRAGGLSHDLGFAHFVGQHRDRYAAFQHLAADFAVTAFRQAGFRTGRLNRLVGNFLVTEGFSFGFPAFGTGFRLCARRILPFMLQTAACQ